jgi:two-component system nitrate/nitrite response regulator NarL
VERNTHRARLLFVDHHRLFADAVRSLLQRERIEVQVAVTAWESLLAARATDPDVVLIDLGFPDEDGIRAGRRIVETCPRSKVVAMTATTERAPLRRATQAGFAGYLAKEPPMSAFIEDILEIVDGGAAPVRRPRGAAARSGSGVPHNERALLAEQLTARELEVLTLLAGGADSRRIATRLSISRNTARSHVQNVLTKLQVHSRLEAATFAVRHGIVDPDRVHRLSREQLAGSSHPTRTSGLAGRLVADPHPAR